MARANSGLTEVRHAVTKLTDISHDVSRMLAVHETRLDRQDQDQRELKSEIAIRREENQKLQSEMYAGLKEQSVELMAAVTKVGTDNKAAVEKMGADYAAAIAGVTKKISTFEKYQWMIVGGAVVISWVFTIVVTVGKSLLPAATAVTTVVSGG